MLVEWPKERWPMIKRFYKSQGHKGYPKGSDRVFSLNKNDQIIAALRLCPLPEKTPGYLLRSLWVEQAARGQGVGSSLLQQLLQQQPQLQPALEQESVWCYPYHHLEAFYQGNGFECIDPDSAPVGVSAPWWRYKNKGHHFLLMRYNLSPEAIS